MAKNLLNLIVDKISLVSKNETPAVPKAETRFSIFKTFDKSEENIGHWTNEQKERITKCKDVLVDLQKK